MKFSIGDLVDYCTSQNHIYMGVILKKEWRDDLGSAWYYKVYFLQEEDEAWIEEEFIRTYGGFNGV